MIVEIYRIFAEFDKYMSIDERNKSLEDGIQLIEEKIQRTIQHKKQCNIKKQIFFDKCIKNQYKMLTFLKKQKDISFYEAMLLYEEL